jgi:hypothetical protein
MLETILIVLGIVAAIVVVLVIVIAVQPADFRVTRSGTMAAPPAEAFAQVNDFHNWDAWSPWAKIDPAMKQTYEGAPAGVGAVYSWVGNSEVGEGKMTLKESQPHQRITIKLEFLKPFKATHSAEFTFKADGDFTIVTWTMMGQKNFITKAFGLVMSMDKMLGGMFEKGLAQMKVVVEAKKVTASN